MSKKEIRLISAVRCLIVWITKLSCIYKHLMSRNACSFTLSCALVRFLVPEMCNEMPDGSRM
jgi:hypothetical protein